MRRKKTIITILAGLLLLSCRHAPGEPLAQAGQYTEMDTAVIAGDPDADRADYLRAKASFYGQNDAAEAKQLCQELIRRKGFEKDERLQQQVYSLLAFIARAQENDTGILEYAPKALRLAWRSGCDEEVGRLSGLVLLAMACNGQTDEAIAQFDRTLASLRNRRTLGSVVAYVSVTKSMLYILRDAVKNEEVLVAADDALRELEHLEQHPEHYTDVPPDFSIAEFVDYERGELFTYKAIACADLGRSGEARRYEALARRSVWAHDNPQFEFTILPLWIALGDWAQAERLFRTVDNMHLSDTLNHQYIRFLHLRALAAHQQGKYAEAERYTTRAFTLRMRQNEYRMQQQIAEQNAAYNLQKESMARERAEARAHSVIMILLLVVLFALTTGAIAAYFIVTSHHIKQKTRSLVKMIDELNSGKRRSLNKVNKDTREEYRRLLSVVFEEHLYAYPQLDRESFAEYMHLTRHELNEILSANTDGLSFPQWLNNIRLERACALLHDEPDKTVSDIAAAVGLSPDNLRRLFRQQYGISPSEYRQNN